MTHDYNTIERLAAQLCRMSGGDWQRKRTKHNWWRERVMRLLDMLGRSNAH